MATTTGTGRDKVMTGDLPEDFLRISTAGGTPAVQQVYYTGFAPTQQSLGRLSITVNQAKLAKNYGITRMDPYCRIRVGNHVFETPTSNNGSTNPRWNKLLSCPLQPGINSVYIEIFDERAFSGDERIAWGLVTIPNIVFEGEALDDWYVLSGKQGDDKEGMINLVFTYTKVQQAPSQQIVYGTPPVVYGQPVAVGGAFPVVMVPQPVVPGAQVVYPGGYGPGQQVPCQTPHVSAADMKNLKEMFPDMDEQVIKSVLEASGGNIETATNNLLSMSS